MAIQMTIILDDKGNLNVNGPLQDKILCLGMIRLAETVVLAHKQTLVNPVSGNLRDIMPIKQ